MDSRDGVEGEAHARVGDAAPLRLAQAESVLDALPSGAVLVDRAGAIAGLNPVAAAIFGYERAALLGRPMEVLVPATSRARHAALRAGYDPTPASRPMGSSRYFEGLRADGATVPLQIGLSLLRTADGDFTLVALTDAREARARDAARDESEARFRQLAESIREVFWLSDIDKDRIVYVSPAYEGIWGRSCEGLYAAPRSWLDAVHPDDRARVAEASLTKQAAGTYAEEYRIVRPDGVVRWVRDLAFPVRDASGRVIRVAGIAEDITDRRRLEAQLLQTQKMESVGLLAGGVAHDFNNWLTVIEGNCEMLVAALPPGEPRELVEEVRGAAGRAATLTRQLLAFSRQQIIEPREVDVGALILDTEKMLRRILGEDILLGTKASGVRGHVSADPGLLVQVLMNLAVNARDAMPRGGRLTIEAAEVDVDDERARLHPGSAPGRYVMIAVSDTGAGMSPAVRARAFEPFFTTKGVGHGTGLGLSVVHGIVSQGGGFIDLYSEPGVGTTFKLYLPAIAAGARHASANPTVRDLRGTEALLVVEDEDTVRRVAVRGLAREGYEVLQASNGEEALALLAARAAPVALLITDVVMPRMDGRELAERAARLWPGMRVLYTSGYTDDTVVRHGILHADVAFLQKPYTPTALLRKVRDVLERG